MIGWFLDDTYIVVGGYVLQCVRTYTHTIISPGGIVSPGGGYQGSPAVVPKTKC